MSQQSTRPDQTLAASNASIPRTVAVPLLLIIPAAIFGAYSIQLNADFTPAQIGQLRAISVFSIIIASMALMGIAWYMTGAARSRLEALKRGESQVRPQDELSAWKEISALSWRYSAVSILIGLIVAVLPVAVIPYSSSAITRDQYLYVLSGGLVSVLFVAAGSFILLERNLAGIRHSLLPRNSDAQIAGRSGLTIASKFQAIVLITMMIAILMLGPLGNHHILRSTQEPVENVLAGYQLQALILSIAVLAIGFGMVFLSTRPVSGFLNQMIGTLVKIEQGDLSQRSPIATTDETAELAVHFNSVITRLEGLQGKLEEEIKVRADQLDAIFEVGQAALLIQDLGLLVEKVVNQVGERFGYYFASIYLIDQSERWAELRGATGAAGQVLLANKHRIDLGDRNLIALSISSRQMQTSLQNADAQTQNPLLPYTRSEIALPLVIGDRIFGVLDVHSTNESAFGPQEVKTLQNIANQVAAAMENARLYNEAQQSVQEMKASQRSYLKTSWDALTSETPALGYAVGDEDVEGDTHISVPLTLRDQQIGEILLTGDSAGWTPEERSIIEAVAAQAALALENARLLEESQAAAARDHLLADITAKVWSATTIDGILQTAIRELGRALETDEAAIELKVE
jgi:GAF domain-containing protein